MTFVRDSRGIDVSILHAGRPRPVAVKLALPPGAVADKGIDTLRFDGSASRESKFLAVTPGIELAPLHEPLRVGDPSGRVRIISTRMEERRYSASLQGRQGHTYTIRATVPFDIESISGGDIVGRDGTRLDISVPFPGSGEGWAGKDLVIVIKPARKTGV
jgi:hypothetical protein